MIDYRQRLILRATLAALALPMVGVRAEPPGGIPSSVRDDSSHIRDWLNGLRGKTEDDVAAMIGHQYEKDSWTLLGKTEKKIRYKFDKESTLVLLFQGEQVVKAEIYVMSEN